MKTSFQQIHFVMTMPDVPLIVEKYSGHKRHMQVAEHTSIPKKVGCQQKQHEIHVAMTLSRCCSILWRFFNPQNMHKATDSKQWNIRKHLPNACIYLRVKCAFSLHVMLSCLFYALLELPLETDERWKKYDIILGYYKILNKKNSAFSLCSLVLCFAIWNPPYHSCVCFVYCRLSFFFYFFILQIHTRHCKSLPDFQFIFTCIFSSIITKIAFVYLPQFCSYFWCSSVALFLSLLSIAVALVLVNFVWRFSFPFRLSATKTEKNLIHHVCIIWYECV